MDIKKLHEKFADYNSPTVEGQIRWLQKAGFVQHQIEMAMVSLYSEIERGEIPKVWAKGKETKYLPASENFLAREAGWSSRDIQNGNDLDQCLMARAKGVRTGELTVMIAKIEEFEAKMRKKWDEDQKNKKPWYKRIF